MQQKKEPVGSKTTPVRFVFTAHLPESSLVQKRVKTISMNE